MKLLLALCLLFTGNARAAWLDQLSCHAHKRVIVIDGKDSDWRSVPISEHSKLKLACVNDRSYLYIYLSPSDRQTQDQLTGKYGQAFTLWLGTAAPTQNLGLRFNFNPPDSAKNTWSAAAPGLPNNFVAQPSGYAGNPWQGGVQQLDAAKLLHGIDILSTDSRGEFRQPAPLTRSSPSGIQAKVGNKQGGIFYEVRVPLLLVYAGLRMPPKTIALGFETSAGSVARDRQASSPGSNSSFGVNYAADPEEVYGTPSSAGAGASRRARRSGGGGGRGSSGPVSAPGLRVWLAAALASAPK